MGVYNKILWFSISFDGRLPVGVRDFLGSVLPGNVPNARINGQVILMTFLRSLSRFISNSKPQLVGTPKFEALTRLHLPNLKWLTVWEAQKQRKPVPGLPKKLRRLFKNQTSSVKILKFLWEKLTSRSYKNPRRVLRENSISWRKRWGAKVRRQKKWKCSKVSSMRNSKKLCNYRNWLMS